MTVVHYVGVQDERVIRTVDFVAAGVNDQTTVVFNSSTQWQQNVSTAAATFLLTLDDFDDEGVSHPPTPSLDAEEEFAAEIATLVRAMFNAEGLLPTVVAGGNLGATEAINMAGKKAVIFTGILNANCVITVENMDAGAELILQLAQDATGGRTVDLPAALYPGGQEPLVGPAADSVTVIRYYAPVDDVLVGLPDVMPAEPLSYGTPDFVSSTSYVVSAVDVAGGIYRAWGFSGTARGNVRGTFRVPDDWTTFSATIEWVNNSASAGNVVWRSIYGFHGPGDNVSLNSVVTPDIVTTAPAQNLVVETELAVLTNQPGKFFYFAVDRDATLAADTLTGQVALLLVTFRKES